jgi:hypothetical protein
MFLVLTGFVDSSRSVCFLFVSLLFYLASDLKDQLFAVLRQKRGVVLATGVSELVFSLGPGFGDLEQEVVWHDIANALIFYPRDVVPPLE